MIEEFSDPVEVWRAAEGDLSGLIALLVAETRPSRRTLDALAGWLSGAFDAEPDLRGIPSVSPFTPDRIRLETAAEDFCRIAEWSMARGFDIDGQSLLKEVAKKWDVDADALGRAVDMLRRSGPRDALKIEARAFRQWQQRTRASGRGQIG
ncbi:hypothetical protein [Rhodovulum euryhalinum]|uniref:Uncharacterized protein n=1 Tax=Rhodovulum euryhalinum TaxID=35805 RepID=A0A4R2KEW2_9RHOB|nr:hypothetical protein [Rhodovulum euryhalinum]TCO72073.1 hypothetical protein EV655_105180 [Rhodovulum euryhalinum]